MFRYEWGAPAWLKGVKRPQAKLVIVAKDRHETVIEAPGWKSRKKFRVQNTAEDFEPLQTPKAFISSSFLPSHSGDRAEPFLENLPLFFWRLRYT